MDHHAWSRRRALAALAAWPAASAAAEAGVGDREIVIGQTLSLQGGKNAYAAAVARGIALVLDETNAGGGIGGRRLVLRTLDDEADSTRAAANARALVAGGVYLLFGSIEGGPSTAVAQVAAEARVPFFGPMAGSPTLRRPFQEMVFPVRAEHRDEFRALMAYGRSLGLRTVGFLHADAEVGRQHLENVRLIAAELGLEVTLPLPLKGGIDDTGIADLAATVRRQGPDLMFNHGSAGVYRRLVALLRSSGSRTLTMAVNSGSSEIARDLGPLAHGMVFSQVMPSPWERKRAIAREYQAAAAARDPQAPLGYGHLEGYVTARALVLALQSAGRNPTRASFVAGLHGKTFDLGGLRLRYGPGDHEGSRFVDLAIFSREGRFIH